jgi:hypothetical protein
MCYGKKIAGQGVKISFIDRAHWDLRSIDRVKKRKTVELEITLSKI